MAEMQTFLGISQKFSNVADFAIIYIEEAHAKDEWKFEMKNDYDSINQHRSIEERFTAAELLCTSTDLGRVKLFVDTFDNNTNELYAALPERLFILYEGTVAYLGGVGPMYYNLDEVERWLETFEKSHSSSSKLLISRYDLRLE